MDARRLAAIASLEGSTALVVGASGGIGASIVDLLDAVGARVIAVDRPGRAAPPGAIAAPCDVASSEGVRALGDRLDRDGERVDVLVHAAGITRDAVLWKISDEAWTEVLRVNLDSAFFLLREFAPRMRRLGRGSIVLLGSINGERGKLGQANYAASKAALVGLAKTAARELGAFGIRVNCIEPGLVETPMTAGLSDDAKRRALGETVLGRLGSPEDVARAVLFFASPMSAHVTGQVLRVDGGQLIA